MPEREARRIANLCERERLPLPGPPPPPSWRRPPAAALPTTHSASVCSPRRRYFITLITVHTRDRRRPRHFPILKSRQTRAQPRPRATASESAASAAARSLAAPAASKQRWQAPQRQPRLRPRSPTRRSASVRSSCRGARAARPRASAGWPTRGRRAAPGTDEVVGVARAAHSTFGCHNPRDHKSNLSGAPGGPCVSSREGASAGSNRFNLFPGH